MRKNPSDTAGVFNVQWHRSFKVTPLSGLLPHSMTGPINDHFLRGQEGGSRKLMMMVGQET